MVLSWTRLPTTAGASERLWLRTEMPSAFQATMLSATSVLAEDEMVMPAPQPQVGKAQPFSQTRLPVMVAPELISKKIPASVLSWIRLPVIATVVHIPSHQKPLPALWSTSLSLNVTPELSPSFTPPASQPALNPAVLLPVMWLPVITVEATCQPMMPSEGASLKVEPSTR